MKHEIYTSVNLAKNSIFFHEPKIQGIDYECLESNILDEINLNLYEMPEGIAQKIQDVRDGNLAQELPNF